ncbi:retrovirus-related pol polyprotein from transposon TNT 1-94 [Tanacetum coccineum]
MDNAQRINKQNQFVPLAVQTRTGTNPVNTAKASSTNKVSTARQRIKREYSNARTPQQNGVAERKNRTLIEAARTMLADSFYLITLFGLKHLVLGWCYVINRTTWANLLKKSDERILVGYSLQSKAFRVYNLVTKRVEENLHINFLENKPNVAGIGPNWLFDLDYLTDSMNYHNDSEQNQANLPIRQAHKNPKQDSEAGSPREEEQIFLDDLARLQIQEKEANEEAEALRKNLDQETEINCYSMRRQLSQAVTNIINLEVDAKQEELLQFEIQKFWTTSRFALWKKEHTPIMKFLRPVARHEAIRIFLALPHIWGLYLSNDVKSAFSMARIDDEVISSLVYKEVLLMNIEAVIEEYIQMSSMGEATFHSWSTSQTEQMYTIDTQESPSQEMKKPVIFQVTPKTSHLTAVKRIFRYLKGKPKLGLWYPRESTFDFVSYSDSDLYWIKSLTKNPQLERLQFLGRRLINDGNAKKQTIVANFYKQKHNMKLAVKVAVVKMVKTHMAKSNDVLKKPLNPMYTTFLPIKIQSSSSIQIPNRTNKCQYMIKNKKIAQEILLVKHLKTMRLSRPSKITFRKYGLVCVEVDGTLKRSPECESSRDGSGDGVYLCYSEIPNFSYQRSLSSKSNMLALESCPKHNMIAYLEKTEGIPVVSTTFVEQFWTSAKSKTINSVRHITAKVAGKLVSITEASIRTDLLFDDADGIDTLPNQAI